MDFAQGAHQQSAIFCGASKKFHRWSFAIHPGDIRTNAEIGTITADYDRPRFSIDTKTFGNPPQGQKHLWRKSISLIRAIDRNRSHRPLSFKLKKLVFLHDYSSTSATALIQPALARSIFTGKQLNMKPWLGKAARLVSFSIW